MICAQEGRPPGMLRVQLFKCDAVIVVVDLCKSLWLTVQGERCDEYAVAIKCDDVHH